MTYSLLGGPGVGTLGLDRRCLNLNFLSEARSSSALFSGPPNTGPD